MDLGGGVESVNIINISSTSNTSIARGGRGRGIAHALLNSIRQLIAPRHALDRDVLVLDARGTQRLLGAGEQRVNDLGVPSRVHDADAQSGTWESVSFVERAAS